jgi:hypothetical protein
MTRQPEFVLSECAQVHDKPTKCIIHSPREAAKYNGIKGISRSLKTCRKNIEQSALRYYNARCIHCLSTKAAMDLPSPVGRRRKWRNIDHVHQEVDPGGKSVKCMKGRTGVEIRRRIDRASGLTKHVNYRGIELAEI